MFCASGAGNPGVLFLNISFDTSFGMMKARMLAFCGVWQLPVCHMWIRAVAVINEGHNPEIGRPDFNICNAYSRL